MTEVLIVVAIIAAVFAIYMLIVNIALSEQLLDAEQLLLDIRTDVLARQSPISSELLKRLLITTKAIEEEGLHD